jgi:hypothetical protein
MKYIVVLVTLFFSLQVTAQVSTNVYWTEQTNMQPTDVIYYNIQHPLVWKDFRGMANENTTVAAMTVSGFGYKADMKNIGAKGQLNIGVYCYFNKNTSWVKPGKTTEYILGHEQHHFNISYIAASFFVEKLKTTSVNLSNYKALLPALYKEGCDMMNKLQADYDGQTKNGQAKDIQAKWNEYLTLKINALIK